MTFRLEVADTIAAARQKIATALAGAGLDDPALEARMLITEALGLSQADLILRADAPIGDAASRLTAFTARRMAREPISRILGTREFCSLQFRITPDVLDPRPETEVLVDAVIADLAARGVTSRPLRILDLGTGSGAILASLLSRLPAAHGTGVDLSAAALEIARENLTRYVAPARFTLRQSRWFAGLAGSFDVIVSNPPYIDSAVIATLDPEVRNHDPLLALDGGVDGLDAYRAIIDPLPAHAAPDAVIGFEVGSGQAGAVAALLRGAGLPVTGILSDLGGHQRVVMAGGHDRIATACKDIQ